MTWDHYENIFFNEHIPTVVNHGNNQTNGAKGIQTKYKLGPYYADFMRMQSQCYGVR